MGTRFARVAAWTVCLLSTACGSAQPEPNSASSESSEGAGQPSEGASSSSSSSASASPSGPSPGERLLPPCAADGKEPPAFPHATEGADYRAIVLVTIGDDGRASHLCFRRVEGPLALEQKALADRGEWRFPVDQAGQKRERTVTFRLRPPPAE
ncbi:MAG TPA: hypothetical protein VLC09_21480 [Polyangiaceae bacterium]|nr:hypothetical protein [Polyangiaceae bacterium]